VTSRGSESHLFDGEKLNSPGLQPSGWVMVAVSRIHYHRSDAHGPLHCYAEVGSKMQVSKLFLVSLSVTGKTVIERKPI